MGRKNNWF